MKRLLLSILAMFFFALGAFAQSNPAKFDGAHYQLAAHHRHHHRRHHHHHNRSRA